MDKFSLRTITKRDKHGFVIACKKGLWSVSGTDLCTVIHEAMHYYLQYASAGEYDDQSLLKGRKACGRKYFNRYYWR